MKIIIILVLMINNCNKSIYLHNVYKDINTELIIEASEGNKDKLIALLDIGADINYKNNEGDTALIIASRKGYVDIVRLLLERRANVDEVNNHGYTASMEAHKGKYNEIVKLLFNYLEIGKIPKIYVERCYALILAATRGEKDKVLDLLEKGADINYKNNNGFTALMNASIKGHTDVVRLLLEKGANVNHKNNNNDTALTRASSEGNIDIVRSLLENGAKVNEKDKSSCTALMKASTRGHIEIAKLLLEKGATVNDISVYGETALTDAFNKGYIEVVKLLIESGTNVNYKKESDEYTILIRASTYGLVDIVELLLAHGANVNDKDNKGYTALLWALYQHRTDVIKLLLEKGADIINDPFIGKDPIHLEHLFSLFINDNERKELLDLLLYNNGNLNIEILIFIYKQFLKFNPFLKDIAIDSLIETVNVSHLFLLDNFTSKAKTSLDSIIKSFELKEILNKIEIKNFKTNIIEIFVKYVEEKADKMEGYKERFLNACSNIKNFYLR